MKAWFSKWLSGFKKNQGSPATYFVHVPKTAGTSLIVLLDRFFNNNQIFSKQLWREVKAIEPENNQQYELYRGHFGGGGVDILTDRPIEFLTILRDPIELARSTYQYVLREKNTKVHELVSAGRMTFLEFLKHEQTKPLIENRMVRNISFDFKKDPAAQEVFLSTETIEYLQSIMQQATSSLTDADRLQRAKNFVEKCRWFGLLERFDESLQLLCFEMSWPPIGPSQKLNVVDKKSALTGEEKYHLEQVNQYDMALYAFAQERFQHKFKAMLHQLENYRTDQEQSIDDLLDLHYQVNHKKVLKSFVKYDFVEVLLGSQWHRREMMQPEQEYFRWTGPGQVASIDFWLKKQTYQIQIRIINAISIDVLNQLEVSINGQALKWQTQDKGVVRVLEMSCSAENIKANGLARLSFNTQKVLSHARAFESDDQRLVGLAVHWIQFKHV